MNGRDTFEQQIRVGRLYAMRPIRKRKLQFALDGICAMQDIAPKSYVSVSFGKQSICLAHMVYNITPETPMYFLASSESWFIHDYVDVIDAFMSCWPIRLTIVQTNNAGLDLSDSILDMSERQPSIEWQFKSWGDPDSNWKESRDIGDLDLQTMTPREIWDGWYWGLSKDESAARRRTLGWKWEGQPHPAVFRYKDGKYRCCPIMNWAIDDIAAYVAEYDIPLLDAYKQHGLEARTTARITRQAAELGGAAAIKRKSSENFNRLASRFPELRRYT